MLTRFALRDITNNSRGLHKFRVQLSTGFRVNRPSDDPNSFLRILPLQSEIKELERYQSNADLASDLVNTAASAFEDASALMARAKELGVQGANGTIGDSDRDTLAASINEILTQMISIANSKLGDRYLFGGSATSQQPFELSSHGGSSRTVYRGNDRDVTIEIAPSSPMIVSSSGRELFMSTKRGATKLRGDTGIQVGLGTDSGRGRAVLRIEHTGFSNLPSGISAGATRIERTWHRTTTRSLSSPSTISIGGGPAIPFGASSTNLAIPDRERRQARLPRHEFLHRRRDERIADIRGAHELGRGDLDRARLHGDKPTGPRQGRRAFSTSTRATWRPRGTPKYTSAEPSTRSRR